MMLPRAEARQEVQKTTFSDDRQHQERLSSAAMILIRLDRPSEDLPERVREEFQAVLHEQNSQF
jgi:hypothetical protein